MENSEEGAESLNTTWTWQAHDALLKFNLLYLGTRECGLPCFATKSYQLAHFISLIILVEFSRWRISEKTSRIQDSKSSTNLSSNYYSG